MQFIFKDGTRTKALDSLCKKEEWKDEMIPEEAPITRIQLVYDRELSVIVGIRFADPMGMSILDLGKLDIQKTNQK